MKSIIERHYFKVFFGTLAIVFLVLGFYNYLQLHPVGPHYIRQVDSFSFVDYYQHHGFNFFETGGWFLGESDGKTASEFPILYYLTALFGLIAGNEHLILRFLTLLLVSIGFYHFFLLLKIILKDVLLALVFSLLFLSSTVVLYYSVNFLPDASALGLVLSGWYFGLKGSLRGEDVRLDKAFIFFLFAGLLKITFLIHPIALVFSLFILKRQQSGSIRIGLKRNLRSLLSLLIILMLVFGWFGYAKLYNNWHDSNIFLTGVTPIWDMTSEAISRTWLAIHHDWFSSYYYQTAFHVFLVIIILGVASSRFKKLDSFGFVTIVLGAGSLCYILLFFKQFFHHDYYMLNCAPFVFFLVILSFRNIQCRFPRIVGHWLVSVGFTTLTVLSFVYASGKLNERFSTVSPLYERNSSVLYGIDKYLNEQSISIKAKIIVLSDETLNGTLYFIKRHGWTISSKDANLVKSHPHIRDANYIFITPDVSSDYYPDLKIIGQYHGVKIFKNTTTSF